MTNSNAIRDSLLNPQALEAIRDERCRRSALFWAQNYTRTENPHFIEQGLEYRARFPRKTYFEVLFRYLATEKRLFIPKSREMLSSWCLMIWAAHQAQWFKSEAIVQTESEDKAKELVGYATCLYNSQESWLKARHPLVQEASSMSIEWKDGGRIFGIPHGEHKIRLYHPTLVIFDEASFLSDFEQSYNAANPVAKQIVAISSAGPGRFADLCSV